MKKYSWKEDVIVAYDREEHLKEAFEANIKYAVADAVEETTKRVTEKNTLDMAKKLKESGVSIDIIKKTTGLSKDKIETI